MKLVLSIAHYLFIVILCFIVDAVSSPAFSAESPIIGYGSSDAVLPAKNQELFYMGFELALRATLDARYGHGCLTVEQIGDGSQLGAVRAARTLVGRGVKMLVGFPTSHEALLAADVAVKDSALAIFSGAGHEKLAQMGDHVFTTGESMDYSVRSMMEFINARYKKDKGLLVVNPRAIFSLNQAETARRIQSASHGGFLPALEFAEVDANLMLPPETIQKLKSGEYKYLFLTQYADESARLLQQFEDKSVDLPIFSNTSWTTGDVEFLRRLITRRKSDTFSSTLWMPGSADSVPFEALVKKTYGRQPTSEMAYGYDLGIIVAKTLNSIKKQPTKDSIQKSFLAQRCFSGLTSGRMCFKPTGGNADRKIYFVRFLKDHFSPVRVTNEVAVHG